MSAPSVAAPSALVMGLGVLIGVSFMGFLAGTREEAYRAPDALGEHLTSDSAPAARSYREQQLSARGHGSGWSEDLAALRAAISRLDPVSLEGTNKAEDLAARASRRAYDGAPPTVPHAIGQGGAPECLACHDEGLRIREATAPMMPHRELSSCTQCHVVEASPVPGAPETPDPRAVSNGFVGLASPTSGPVWSMAPPQIPHPTAMREACLSCHGPLGASALRSTHPSRESCTQCHTSSAELDLRPGFGQVAGAGPLSEPTP